MSVTFEVKAELRGDLGKGASRRLRRAGKVPAILYGGGQDPLPLVLEQLSIDLQLQNEAIYSHVLTLNLGDRTESVVLRDLQRHPFKPTVLHLDFMRVSADRKLRVHVPLHFINEEISPAGKTADVLVTHELKEVHIACLPKDLPQSIEVDLASLTAGDIIYLSQLKLPAGVEIPALKLGKDHDDAVVIAKAPSAAEEAAE